jgi:hypothetical protein
MVVEFECLNCKQFVMFQLGDCAHDHCPYCNFSLHCVFGYTDLKPCGSLMTPTDAGFSSYGEPILKLTCQGCEFVRLTPYAYIQKAEDFDFTWLNSLQSQGERRLAAWRDSRRPASVFDLGNAPSLNFRSPK